MGAAHGAHLAQCHAHRPLTTPPHPLHPPATVDRQVVPEEARGRAKRPAAPAVLAKRTGTARRHATGRLHRSPYPPPGPVHYGQDEPPYSPATQVHH